MPNQQKINNSIIIYIYIYIYILFYMDEQIETIYKKINYPNSVQKLLNLVKSAGINATSKDIQPFLDKRVSVQQTKVTKKSRKSWGK